jgi:hypothetical protein
MHHTTTERGITNKNLLLGFNTGQLYSLDTRMVDPRRPINAPTQAEKEEVFYRRNTVPRPFLPLYLSIASARAT